VTFANKALAYLQAEQFVAYKGAPYSFKCNIYRDSEFVSFALRCSCVTVCTKKKHAKPPKRHFGDTAIRHKTGRDIDRGIAENIRETPDRRSLAIQGRRGFLLDEGAFVRQALLEAVQSASSQPS
jgi:hypothetical protein